MSRPVAPGDEFGRYRVLRQIGAGGMGVVYAAHDTQLDREVALKVVAPHQADNEEHRARFEREAAVMARIDSPHVVQVHDFGEREGSRYLVTQLIAGGDLDAHTRREGRLEPALAGELLAQVCRGLAQAHAAGVTHRDVKPSNVLLRAGSRRVEAVLCDFGIASMPGVELTRTGAITGSLLYMAPERHRGETAGVSGDIYSAGCLLWFALTGSAPYAGTEVEIAMAHLEAPIPQLPGREEFARRVNQVLRQSMAKDPGDRYRSAQAMEADLRAAVEVAPATTTLPEHTSIRRPIGTTTGSARRARLPWMALTAASVAVAMVLGGMLLSRGERNIADLPIVPTAQEADTTVRPPAPSSTVVQERIGRERPTERGAPRGSRKDGPDSLLGLVTEAPLPVTAPAPGTPRKSPAAGPSPAAKEPEPTTRPGRTTEPKPSSSPSPTKEPEPEPEYRWTCWNGTNAYEYADCSRPYGRAGADWIYPQLSDLGCARVNIRNSAQDIESWRCEYSGPKPGQNAIRFTRWTSVSAAKAFQRSLYADAYFEASEWRPNGYYGVRYLGRSAGDPGERRWRVAKIYTHQPWTMDINAAEFDNRNKGSNLVTMFRHPDRFNGVPKS